MRLSSSGSLFMSEQTPEQRAAGTQPFLTFPQQVAFRRLAAAWPQRGHAFHNGGVPGVFSSYMNACLRLHLPQDAELVVVRPEREPSALKPAVTQPRKG